MFQPSKLILATSLSVIRCHSEPALAGEESLRLSEGRGIPRPGCAGTRNDNFNKNQTATKNPPTMSCGGGIEMRQFAKIALI
jgi:hypothetical protein